ncbi:MAG: hypothetical protein ACQETJ_11820, partial [Bacteroidota bacterium]
MKWNKKTTKGRALRKQTTPAKTNHTSIGNSVTAGFGKRLYLLPVQPEIKQNNHALYGRNMELTKITEQEQVVQHGQSSVDNEMKNTNYVFFEELFEQIKKYIIQNKRYLDSGLKVADIAS